MKSKYLFASFIVLALSIPACQKTDQKAAEAEEPATLEEIVKSDDLSTVIMNARQEARKNVALSSLEDIDSDLRSHDTIYWPEGDGPFPAVLFFHGCSGKTVSHEDDWAERYNSIGVAVISVDSYGGRGLDWNDVCNLQKLLPWQRANDVLSTIRYAREHDKIKGDELYLSGFSHGAMTVWATLGFASTQSAPIGLAEWPEGGIDGVKAAFLFYGSCIDSWDVDVDTTMFLAREDQYIDEAGCEAYLENHSPDTGPFTVTIYDNATHTFDHAKPNAANVAAGSKYDEAATLASWQRIQDVITQN